MKNKKNEIDKWLVNLAEWIEPKITLFHRTLRSLVLVFFYALFFYMFVQFMEFQTEIACEAKTTAKNVGPTYKDLSLVE